VIAATYIAGINDGENAVRAWWDRYGWIVAFIVLAALAVIIIFDYFPTRADMCGDGAEHCFREWASALSGWAAAAAALLSITVLVKQLKSQQSQTEFMVGDALPTIIAHDHDETNLFTITLYLTNWNRRPFLVESIADATIGIHYDLEIMDVKTGDQSVFGYLGELESERLKPPVLVRGWEDRNSPPPEAKFAVRAIARSGKYDAKTPITLKMGGTLLGDKRRSIDLTAEGLVLTF
jgi:hypothetical protein